ncbi:unnamed protein product [Linum trigynum]|uniref:Gnk2-homologous domain-containing protein n=1 Tax=Linum trigynum TaxID=586398 RepID=A0AAV2DAU0_9ROSI
MAGCLKKLLTVVLVVVGYLGCGSSDDICGTTPAAGPNFAVQVDVVLLDLFMNTRYQSPDPSSGLTTYTSTQPPDSIAGSGAATGTATCSSVVTGDSCYYCLYALAQYVDPCSKFTTGSASYPQRCSIQFQQL